MGGEARRTRDVVTARARFKARSLARINSPSVVCRGQDSKDTDARPAYSIAPQSPYVDSRIPAGKAVPAFDGRAVTRTCAMRPPPRSAPTPTSLCPTCRRLQRRSDPLPVLKRRRRVAPAPVRAAVDSNLTRTRHSTYFAEVNTSHGRLTGTDVGGVVRKAGQCAAQSPPTLILHRAMRGIATTAAAAAPRATR